MTSRQRAQLTLKSVWQGVFTVMGVELRCHVLNDGQRVIEADDVRKFVEMLGSGDYPPNFTEASMMEFAKWLKGVE